MSVEYSYDGRFITAIEGYEIPESIEIKGKTHMDNLKIEIDETSTELTIYIKNKKSKKLIISKKYDLIKTHSMSSDTESIKTSVEVPDVKNFKTSNENLNNNEIMNEEEIKEEKTFIPIETKTKKQKKSEIKPMIGTTTKTNTFKPSFKFGSFIPSSLEDKKEEKLNEIQLNENEDDLNNIDTFNFGDFSAYNAKRMEDIKKKLDIKDSLLLRRKELYKIMKDTKTTTLIALAVQKNTNQSFNLSLCHPIYDNFNQYSNTFIIMSDDIKKIINHAMLCYENNYSAYDVLRSNYSKLYFDIDCHDITELEQLRNTLKIIFDLTNIFESSLTGGIVIRDEELYEEINQMKELKEVLLIKSPMKKNKKGDNLKILSGHIQIKGLYFNRTDITKELFKGLTLPELRKDEKTKGVFDTSIFTSEGTSHNFRLFFTIKPLEPNTRIDLTQEQKEFILNNPENFLAQRLTTDKEIYNSDSKFLKARQYLEETFKNILKVHKPKTKKDAKEMLIKSIDETDFKNLKTYNKTQHKANKINDYDEWRLKLIDKMKIYKYLNPNCDFNELYNEFIKPEHQRITASGRTEINNSATKYTANLIMNMKKITLKSFFNYHHEITENFDKFNELIKQQHIFNIIELMSWINNTFIFFTSSDYKNICMIKEDGKNKIKKIQDVIFDEQLIIKINFIYESQKILYEYKLKDIIIYYSMCQNYYQKYDIYSLNDDIFHLYNLPTTTNENVELDEETKQILLLLCNDDNEGVEYVLNWFAYVLQHPESRNHTALHFVSKVQGTGKNTICNMLCKFLNQFSKANTNIEDILGRFNGTVEDSKLIIINECPLGKKNNDKLKAFITDDKIIIERKGIDQIEKDNLTNLIILSNNFDTGIIENQDRRFSFFYTELDKFEKIFYDDYFDNIDSHYDNFIKFLLSRDLSNYNENLAYDKDSKQILYEKRELLRHPIYKLIEYLDLPELTIIQLKTIINYILDDCKGITLTDEEEKKPLTKEEKLLKEKIDKISKELIQDLKDSEADKLNNKGLINLVQFQNNPDYNIIKNGNETKIINTKQKFEHVLNEIIEELKIKSKISLKELVEKYKSRGLNYSNYKTRLISDKFMIKKYDENVYIVKTEEETKISLKTYFETHEKVMLAEFLEVFPQFTKYTYKKNIEEYATAKKTKKGIQLISKIYKC